ncbi:DUF4352 domain-containing protein [Longispora urticae]
MPESPDGNNSQHKFPPPDAPFPTVPDDTIPPGQAGPPPPPFVGYPPGPPLGIVPAKKNKKGLWIGLGIGGAVLVLCCFGGMIAALAGGKDSAKNAEVAAPAEATKAAGATASPAAPAKEAAVAGIGTAVRDGKFEFVVQKIECGKTQVGGEYLNKKAQGQFCMVTLAVKNIGDKPQTLYDSNQKGFGANNARYAPDSTAGLYANSEGDGSVWITEINPGNQVTGLVVFDIPKDGKLLTLELHDSAFSGGVKVKLQ